MDLGSKRKTDISFNMASMTDIIFLLLIFFMLTSSFVTPSGLPVDLPSSKGSNIVMQKVTVTATADGQYFVNGKEVPFDQIENKLDKALKGTQKPNKEGRVVLHIDKDVPSGKLVKIAGICSSLEAKVSVAARPEN